MTVQSDFTADHIPQKVLALAVALNDILQPHPEAPAFYTSLTLPPGSLSDDSPAAKRKARRRFNSKCKRIAEAIRDGNVWRVPISAYEAVLRGSTPHATPKHPQAATAAEILAQNGLKLRAPR